MQNFFKIKMIQKLQKSAKTSKSYSQGHFFMDHRVVFVNACFDTVKRFFRVYFIDLESRFIGIFKFSNRYFARNVLTHKFTSMTR